MSSGDVKELQARIIELEKKLSWADDKIEKLTEKKRKLQKKNKKLGEEIYRVNQQIAERKASHNEQTVNVTKKRRQELIASQARCNFLEEENRRLNQLLSLGIHKMCGAKLRYRTAHSAHNAAIANGQRAYRCPACNKWHLTSQL
jgi:DNA repair exonuclease SbcCD ATPase subunit